VPSSFDFAQDALSLSKGAAFGGSALLATLS
jgi:hypothetical protein